MRQHSRAVMLLLSAALMLSCAPLDPTDGGLAAEEAADTSGANGDGGNGGGGNGGGGNGGGGNGGGGDIDEDGDGVIEVGWVPFGPASPSTPGQHPKWYAQLHQRDCASVLELATLGNDDLPEQDAPRLRRLYAGAARACLATEGGPGSGDLWASAADDLRAVGGAGGLDCLNAETHRALAALVAAHESGAGVVLTTTGGGATACPWTFTGVEPAEGKTFGGYDVELIGDYLWGLQQVCFGDTCVEVLNENSDGSSVVVVPEGVPGAVDVTVVSPAARATLTGAFTYVADEEGSGGGGEEAGSNGSPDSGEVDGGGEESAGGESESTSSENGGSTDTTGDGTDTGDGTETP